jgi:predicted  nucleic acid-binding Zn-ribbon protein
VKQAKFFVVACVVALALSSAARADMTSDLKAQVDALQRQLEAVKLQLDQVQREQQEQRQQQKAPQSEGVRLFSGSQVTLLRFLRRAAAR